MGTHRLRGKAFPSHAISHAKETTIVAWKGKDVDRAQNDLSHMWMHQIETISKDLCTPNLHQIIDTTPHGSPCGTYVDMITSQINSGVLWLPRNSTLLPTRERVYIPNACVKRKRDKKVRLWGNNGWCYLKSHSALYGKYDIASNFPSSFFQERPPPFGKFRSQVVVHDRVSLVTNKRVLLQLQQQQQQQQQRKLADNHLGTALVA